MRQFTSYVFDITVKTGCGWTSNSEWLQCNMRAACHLLSSIA